MKRDKAQLIQAIEAIKEKLAQMEEELNKHDEFKHFPSKGDEYYYYTSIGTLYSNTAGDDELRVSAYETEEDAQKAYNKAVATEKIKRRLLELQGEWEPNFNFDFNKYIIFYNYNNTRFESSIHSKVKFSSLIPYIKTRDITETIINEMEDELKLIFDIA